MENTPVSSRIRLRKVLLWVAVVAAVFMSLAAVLTWQYGDSIKQLVLGEINERLDAEVNVEDIRFSLIRHFPFASVNCKGVSVVPAGGDTLLAARSLSLLFKVTNLWTGRYVLEQAKIRDGHVYIHVNAEGKANYQIWRTNTSDSASLNVHLENIKLQNMALSYVHEKANQSHAGFVEDGRLDVRFEGDRTYIAAHADLGIGNISVDGNRYLSGVVASLGLQMDLAADSIRFRGSKIRIGEMDFAVNGDIRNAESHTDYRLTISSGKSGFADLISLLPEAQATRWRDYRLTGIAELELTISGRSSGTQRPQYRLAFETTDASARAPGSDISVEALNVSGFYAGANSGSGKGDSLAFNRVSGSFRGQPFSGRLLVRNLDDPLLDCEASAVADLEALSRFYRPDTLDYMKGTLEVRGASFTGKLSRPTTYVSSGNVSWKDGALKLKGRPNGVKEITGAMTLERNNLKLSTLAGRIGSSNFTFSGELRNFFGYLFGDGEKLDMKLDLTSSNLVLNDILERDTTVTLRDTVYRIRFADNVAFTMQASIERFRFNRFTAQELRGTVHLRAEELYTERLRFRAMDGSVSMSGSIRETGADSLAMRYRASVTGVDIHKLFYEMGNFGQEALTDRNLRGQVTAEVDFDSRWSSSLDCNTDRIRATADLEIANGELLEFSPMAALSKLVKGADLNRIRFSTLKNSIRIESRTVHIPQMEINSSAMNIVLSGTHSFDNMIDYQLQLLLSQLLGKKVRNMNTEFGTIEEDNLGRSRLFIAMKGPAEDPRFTYDARGVRQKIASDIRKEKQVLKDILQEEFGKKEKEAPPQGEEELQIELEPDPDY